MSVDFGGSGLRAVEFTGTKKGPVTVHSVAEVPLPVGAIHRGLITDSAAVTEALKAVWKSGRFKSKDVVFGIANSAVMVKRVEVAWMEPKLFAQSLRYQVPDGILMDGRGYILDFHTLDEFDAQQPDGSSHRMVRVLLVAAEEDMVQPYVDSIKAAGLRPFMADHLAFAFTRLAGSRAQPGVELLIDIGAHSTNLVLHQNGQPLFVRNLPKGTEGLIDELSARFQWTREVAADAIITLGVSSSINMAVVDSAFTAGGPAPAGSHPAQPIIDQHAAEFISEIRNSVDWFLQNTPSIPAVDRVLFSGGGSLIGAMGTRIASELHIPVEIAQPFSLVKGKNIPIAATQSPRWTAALGLATGVN